MTDGALDRYRKVADLLRAGCPPLGVGVGGLLELTDAAIVAATAAERERAIALHRTGRFCHRADHMQQMCDCDEFESAIREGTR
jgi:hypothetical protein